ncbi:DUF3237 family protein [Streptomyces sp. NPDC090994]|uniref:DUF3237 family protein n=1 Tax=Streptomyces sp. NPDC090994 TaxID=3365969 RepID=UPI003828BEE3
MTVTPPRLRHAFTIVAEVAAGHHVGDTGAGDLTVVPITGGTVEGGGLRGKVLPGGADWAIRRPDGSWLVEARYQLMLDSGTVIDVLNTGLALPTGGGPRQPEYGYFPTRPVFRTGAEPYRWLTDRVFLGWGGSSREATTIDVFTVEAP